MLARLEVGGSNPEASEFLLLDMEELVAVALDELALEGRQGTLAVTSSAPGWLRLFFTGVFWCRMLHEPAL